MKPIYRCFVGAVALSIAMAAPAAESENWMDAPQTPGDWSYVDEPGESLALFGDANPTHLFVMRCNKSTRQVGIARRGEAPGNLIMRIRTETTDRILTASQVPGWDLVAASVPGTDQLLDAMAISKGRFAVETEGFPTLYIPSWPEVTRVIEDCR